MSDETRNMVTLRECARRLGVSHSTISRQVRDGVIPNHGDFVRPLVDVAEARERRALSLNSAKARWPAYGASQVPADLTGAGSLNEARRNREHYAGELARVQLEEKLGKLVSKADVGRDTFEAFRLLRDRVMVVAVDVACACAQMNDERAIAALIRAELTKALKELSNAAAATATSDSAANGNAAPHSGRTA